MRKRSGDIDPAVLDDGLRLAMEWGEDWLEPIQSRLAELHPGLALEELDHIDAICRETMRFGHAEVAQLVRLNGLEAPHSAFEEAMHVRYPWVGAENLGRLFSQGMYYALK